MPDAADHLSQTFAALADPTRRAILARLSQGEANVSDLAKPFLKEMSLPAVTKHLKGASDWMEQYRKFWEESFDRLDAYLKTVTSKGKTKKRKKDGREK